MAERYEFIKISPHEDFRGELKKIFTKSMLGTDKIIEEIYVLYTNKDCIRGNHYHKENVEFFMVIKGTAVIAVKDLPEGDTEIFRVSDKDNIVIKVPENVAHSFRNDEEEVLVILAAATKQYNTWDTDTYKLQLL